ncbi:MAG TPA: helix-turn-helix transcriptional regulator [Novosphingobium sp.]|nr:helix-turn-helix transcriptional regulator [Novosphingobium sp.]HMP55428.1 helix-turn-helix transcriptional regulator [Novosphingobium sp.]
MDYVIEQELRLPGVCVSLATVRWGPGLEELAPHDDYRLCQRLSGDHAPLRIGNLPTREAFPRVRSVGFLPPGQPVSIFPGVSAFRALNCSFSRDHFEATAELGEDLWADHAASLVTIRNRRLEVLMQEIHAELVQPSFGRDLLVDAAGTMILVELARYGRELERASPRSAAVRGLAPWQLRRIQERLAASPQTHYPDLAELAALCGISKSHLMRSFKASTGWQIHKFIAEERLKSAKAMLQADHHSFKEIARLLGFGSAAYFATAFRRMTGMTPSDYRKKARGSTPALH